MVSVRALRHLGCSSAWRVAGQAHQVPAPTVQRRRGQRSSQERGARRDRHARGVRVRRQGDRAAADLDSSPPSGRLPCSCSSTSQARRGAASSRISDSACVGALFVALGTLCSRSPWLAAVAMAVVGFVVLFSGVINGYFAAAATGALLTFVLPVTIPASELGHPGPAGRLGPRGRRRRSAR